MEILENYDSWATHFRSTWLKHLEQNGEVNWDLYKHPRNKENINSDGLTLSQSKIMLLTSSGTYLKNSQDSFDSKSLYGDYSSRTIPMSSNFEELDYAHTHYDHTSRKLDAQVNLPLRHLGNLVKENFIGAVSSNFISITGYQPDLTKLIEELIPSIIDKVKKESPDALFLVPV